VTDATIVHPRVEHMPPAAVALAVLLHALVGVSIWWLSPSQPTESQDDTIMVTLNTATMAAGQQDPAQTGQPASPPPSTEPGREPEQQQALAPAQPQQSPEPAQPSQSSEAVPQPEPVPTLPIYEFSIPPVPEPPPAPTSRDFPKPPTTAQPRPAQRTQPLPARPAPPTEQQRPPAEASASMPAPLPGADPADAMASQGRMRNDYLARVARQIAQQRVYPAGALSNHQRGRLVARVTVARSGQVVDVRISTSSGWPAIDAAEVETIRKAAPFPPLPNDMPGETVILMLPVNFNYAPGR
jgi:periplasmic protein TonB